MKMSGFLSVLLVISVTLLFTAKGQSNYNTLSENEKKYVDMAIKNANEKTWVPNMPNNEHFNFHQIIGNSLINSPQVQINLLLKATVCSKASSSSGQKHRSECAFKPRRPYINCVVCNTDSTNTNFYVDCVRQKDVDQVNNKRVEICWTLSGAHSLLTHAKVEELQTGCLGCF